MMARFMDHELLDEETGQVLIGTVSWCSCRNTLFGFRGGLADASNLLFKS